jgi:predicted membrane protein
VNSPRYHRGMFVVAPKGVFFSLLIIGLGVIFLLDQMGIVSAHYVFRYFWPAIFIFLGLDSLLFCRGVGRSGGIFFTLLGAVLLLGNLGYLHFRWTMIWPFILIYWGAWMLFRSLRRHIWGRHEMNDWDDRVHEWVNRRPAHDAQFEESNEGTLRLEALFSTVKRRITAKNFTGGKVEAVFGEVELDLREADIEGDKAVLKADAVFGSGTILVPNTWVVRVLGSPVMGEYSDRTNQRPPEGSGTKQLVIRGGAVFGSIVIKN